MADDFQVDKDELKQRLTPEEFDVTQNAGTEAPFTGKYWDEHADGTYTCKVCGQVLFDSQHKFESSSFGQALIGPYLDRLRCLRTRVME